jgi:hypothetical protein
LQLFSADGRKIEYFGERPSRPMKALSIQRPTIYPAADVSPSQCGGEGRAGETRSNPVNAAKTAQQTGAQHVELDS